MSSSQIRKQSVLTAGMWSFCDCGEARLCICVVVLVLRTLDSVLLSRFEVYLFTFGIDGFFLKYNSWVIG